MQTQEKCIREITTTLQKCISRHYVKEFAALLHLDITANEYAQQADVLTERQQESEHDHDHHHEGDHAEGEATAGHGLAFAAEPRAAGRRPSRAGSAGPPGKVPIISTAQLEDAEEVIEDSSADTPENLGEPGLPVKRKLSASQGSRAGGGTTRRIGRSLAKGKQQAEERLIASAERHADALTPLEELALRHSVADDRQRYKLVKALANVTPNDIVVEQRQKNGQLRFGDIICLSFHENLAGEGGKGGGGDIYRSLVYSDGVTEQGLKVLPYWSKNTQTALNQFKQCLFRVEIQQNCTYHMREAMLIKQKQEAENRLKRLVQGSGVEGPNKAQMNHIKKEIDLIAKDLAETKKKRKIQDENNTYEQKYRDGNKLTYAMPIMLRHLFSGKYLSLKIDEVSVQPGQNVLCLSEVTEYCWFILEPSGAMGGNSQGLVINYTDFFHIRSLNCKTPFYLHVVLGKKETMCVTESYTMNASSEASTLKAKLFLPCAQGEKESEGGGHISNGSCIRLRQLEADAYLTTPTKDVDVLLPTEPDFLKGQIRRMHLGQKIERLKGGLDVVELHGNEKVYRFHDSGFELENITDDYIARLKARAKENVYLEPNADELKFTNSCWEIQRANPLHGGALSTDELVKLKHIGTGNYLALAQDGANLELLSHSNTLSCLFYLRAPHSTPKQNVYVPPKDRRELTKDNTLYVSNGQNIILQSFLVEQYLRVEGVEEAPAVLLDSEGHSVSEDTQGETKTEVKQLKVIASEYLKKSRNKMIFVIEEIEDEQSRYSYQGSLIFDKLLEFYAFLNVWAVSPVKQEEKSEQYFYKPDKAAELEHLLQQRASQVEYILSNVGRLLKSVQFKLDEAHKCKTEIAEQGFLDIILRILQMSYYKLMPPPLLEKPFKSTSEAFREAELKSNKREQLGIVDLATFRIDKYSAQEIARETLNPVVLHALEVILVMVRDHNGNSELAAKYQSVLYQVYCAHEKFFLLGLRNVYFQSPSCPNRQFLVLIGEIFKRMMKNAKLLHSITDEEPELEKPTPFKTIEKTVDSYTVQKWLAVLGPVRFLSKNDQNVDKQIMVLQVLANMCKGYDEQGVYPYQVQVRQHILEDSRNIPIKFGTGVFKNVLRPFVFIERPRNEMTLKQFLDQNPILGDNNNFRIDQKGQIEYEMTLDLHELTANANKEGWESQPYIDYICACIELLLACSKGGRFKDTKRLLEDLGLDQEHLLLCISPDAERLVIHEQLKQTYMKVCNELYIDIELEKDRICRQNRCYIWERCVPTDQAVKDTKDYFIAPLVKEATKQAPGRSEEPIRFNFAEELAAKKLTVMHNPNDCMIQLVDGKSKRDEKMIRAIKDNIVWFLTRGPCGTDSFFADHANKLFIHTSLKLKLKSVKVYLQQIIVLLQNDLIEPKFIENVKMICQTALLGSLHYNREQEKDVPSCIRTNWLYILMWIAKDICLKSEEIWKTENALTCIGCQIFDIFDLVSFYRLNLQIEQFVIKFRKFEETQLYADGSGVPAEIFDLETAFEDLFKIQQYDIQLALTDLYNSQLVLEANPLLKGPAQAKRKKKMFDSNQTGSMSTELAAKKIPLDQVFLNIIISPLTNIQVKQNALEVLIRNLNQRDILIKELSKTEIIVDPVDYRLHLKFFENLKVLTESLDGLMIDEKYNRMINIPQMQTKALKDKVVNLIQEMTNDMKRVEPLTLRRVQNLVRQSGLIDMLLNGTLKQLENKEFYYKDLFQTIIDFFHQSCLNNPNVQSILLPNLNYFLDMMNQRIVTDKLISEIIKSNASENQRKEFADYLIKKILTQGYFKSNLINYLTNLAQEGGGQPGEDAQTQEEENSNQQFIMKQIIKSSKFRTLLYMTRATNSVKLGTIKTYFRKKQLYEKIGKEVDHELLQDKETLDLHIAVVDLVTTCARNSIFGISQVKKLIEIDELLDSLISEAIPFEIKSHYFNLLFEVYLRKVQGQEDSQRLPITDFKFVSMLKYTIQCNLDESFDFFAGLFLKFDPINDTAEKRLAINGILQSLAADIKKTKDERFLRGTDQDRDKEKEQRESLCSNAFKDAQACPVLDQNDETEYWRSLNYFDENTKTKRGMFVFIENVYKYYAVREMDDNFMIEVTCKIRESLLNLAYQICNYVDSYDSFMQPFVQDLLFQLNQAVQTMPERAMFRMDQSKEEVDEDEVKNAGDVDNRMSREKILRIIRDHIMRENIPIKEAIGLEASHEGMKADLDTLKEAIKRVTGPQASYHDIMKALDFFHNVAVEKEKKRKEEQANNDSDEGSDKEQGDPQSLYFTELEIALQLSLEKAGHRSQPTQGLSKRTGNAGASRLNETPQEDREIQLKDLSIAIFTDFKLFTQRFYEVVVKQKNFAEVHDYVNMLMKQESLLTFGAKVDLIRNLLHGFLGLEGDDDELVLISILKLVISRLLPEGEPAHVTLAERRVHEKQSANLQSELKEWQNVMFEAGVPQFLFEMTSVEQDPMLANQALQMLNKLLIEASAENQQRVLDLLKEDNRFFTVFHFMQQRIIASKGFIQEQLQKQARDDFVGQNIMDVNEAKKIKPNDFKNHHIFMSPKFDLEFKYGQMQAHWKEEEIYTFLDFMSLFCENCFQPAQLYLRCQLEDSGTEAIGLDITSVDLIYQTVQLLIEMSDCMNQFLFSAFRTNKLIPAILDTFIEFLFGPCCENQQFLGGNKKLISVFNDLILHKDWGNFAPNHQQSKSRLVILNKVSRVLLAIVDIKDPEIASRVHEVILAELDIPNIVRLCVDIWAYRIGGTPQMKYVYEYNMQCDHAGKPGYACIEDEFCELEYLLPCDRHTIEAGFNLFQALQVLARSNPGHTSLQVFKRDDNEFLYLMQNESEYLANIAFQHQRTSAMESRNFEMWTKLAVRVLDEVIIKTFPETFIAFIEKTASELKDLDQSAMLVALMNDAKKTKNPIDRQQILLKIRGVIREVILPASAGEHPIQTEARVPTEQMQLTQSEADQSVDGLLLPENEYQLDEAANFKKVKTSTTTQFLQLIGLKSNKVQDFDAESMQPSQIENNYKAQYQRQEFIRQMNLLKFYLAANFYEDNIGMVELLQSDEGPMVTDSFQIPSFFKHLTLQTSDSIPFFLNQVSQQEKLESFVSQTSALVVEMKWQQRLGQISLNLKFFANKWELLSWVNFITICVMNLNMILFMAVDPNTGDITFKTQVAAGVNQWIGSIQTAIAGVVVLSYYVEYRAVLKYKIQLSEECTIQELPNYGENRGSYGYGNQKSNKSQVQKQTSGMSNSIKKFVVTRAGTPLKLLYLCVKEVHQFLVSLSFDSTHTRNIIYFAASVYANTAPSTNGLLFNTLLLLDIVKKIKALGQVFSIFKENSVALLSTLALFGVLLYIYAFVGFQGFRSYFSEDNGVRCETLIECFLSTTNLGLRSGGGIGEALLTAKWEDDLYATLWLFNFTFFMVINLVLMNIFFGIIIDSFADKRAKEAEIQDEVEGQCFICGIQKSTFEIANVPWKDHIYTQHNLHSYLSFLIAVSEKDKGDCTGIEKFVKTSLDSGNMSFFPINRCIAINNGETLE